ncbi:MAG: hypothetical protein GF418_03240 [Chitinivibrionales bacterium]|nr:hypothetical protein [Chitinivibrionales bacterium]MBD3394617.1 hypothetical protein [Chitinivibrionales bacterium]
MKRYAVCLAGTVVCLSLTSCGTSPMASHGDAEGSVSVRVWVDRGMSKAGRALQTTWDSLVVLISAPDMSPVRRAIALDPLQPAVLDTIDGVPEGDGRVIEAWTCTREGVRIHHGASDEFSVESGRITPVALQLGATRGSIYINLANVPADVDSVYAGFYFGADSLCVKDKRSALMYLSIDNVPDSTGGILVIRGVDARGATVYADSLEILFCARQNVSMQAEFLAKEGGFALDLALDLPGVTVVSGLMEDGEAPEGECGPLVISEIMYYAEGDSDYIEIHNPADVAFQIDTLTLEVVNTSSTTTCRIPAVTIEAGGFLVVGDTDAPPAWTDTSCALNLTTTGRWVALKGAGGSLIDRVSYTRNDQEWPDCPKYSSIELLPEAMTPRLNNYGRNWRVAETPIDGTECFGTPGR